MAFGRGFWSVGGGELSPNDGQAVKLPTLRITGSLEIDDINRRSAGGGNITLATDDAFIQSVDPGGAISLTLPGGGGGLSFRVANRGASTEDITVQNGSGTTIATVGPGDYGTFVHDGTVWLGGSASGQVV